MLVPDMSDSGEDEETGEKDLTTQAEAETERSDDESDGEGNPLPEMVKQAIAAQKRIKPRIEEVTAQENSMQ